MQRAIRPEAPHLHIVVLALAYRPGDFGVGLLAIVRMQGAQENLIAHRRIEGQSEKCLAAVRPGELLRPQIPAPSAEFCGFLRELQLSLAFTKPGLDAAAFLLRLLSAW